MSIDFDSAALQTQHEEEEYDQEDYAREQELHKLLTDLPDDMLEDSRDSSLELEYSTCSNKNIANNSPQSNGVQQWSDHVSPTNYNQPPYEEYTYGDRAVNGQMNGHRGHNQTQPHIWNQQPEGHQFDQGDYTYSSIGTAKSTESNEFSTDDYGLNTYPQGSKIPVEYNRDGGYRDRQVNGNHFQMFNSQPHQGQEMDQLQRDFLDSTAKTVAQEQLAQLQVLHKAQQRQIEDLEQKLEDSRRSMRYVEHQFAIVKDEKDGLAVSLKESCRLVEDYKEREVKMQKTVKVLEQQVKVLTEKDQENVKKQRVADAAVDTMKQQMLDLCRSDTLSKSREQHDRDIAVIREQHEAVLLASQQKLDSTSQELHEQLDLSQRLREQVKQLERQREEEQLERARVINALTQRLEESQQQCGKLLQTSSVQEISQLQIKLQQAQSAKTLSENMNKALQEDLADLKEQITLYESAVKHGVLSLDQSNDLENRLSESCIDLGLKKTNLKNGTFHSPLAILSDSKLPKDEALRLLRAEMQRCLGNLKGKRQKINKLQEELQLSKAQVDELQTQLEEAKLGSKVRENGQIKHLDVTGASQKELKQLKDDKQHLQEQVEALEKKNKELKQNEEKVRAANLELCTKMREMIQELDQEKQEAAQRAERIHQQHRDDVVNNIRTELMLEHSAQIEQLTEQHQQQLQQLQTQLSEANDRMLAVQECYISVCKEKDTLEESIRNKEKEDAALKETEQKMREESNAALKKLRAEMEAQHQASIIEMKAVWTKEKESGIQKQVQSQVALAKSTWKEELQKMEQTWAQRLEAANQERNRQTAVATCQTDLQDRNVTVTVEELDSKLSAQKHQLQMEADKAKQKAVEEMRKQIQKELHEKHLEDMAKQVEGAVTRAYSRWVDDLASLPEYQALLQTEKEKWEELQKLVTEQRISQALRAAEDQWNKRQRNQLEEQSSGAQREQELEQCVANLQSQLEQVRREQAALLNAELAAARASWNRDKQQEISIIQVRSEQVYQTKLQEQRKNLEQALQQVKEDADLQKKELLSKTEAKLQQSVKAREEELKCYYVEKEQAEIKQIKDELQADIQTALAQVQTQLFMDPKTEQRGSEVARGVSGTLSDGTITDVIQNFCKDIVNGAVSQAKKEWNKISEDKLSLVLKETQEQYEKEINRIHTSASQRAEQARCKRECTETVSKLKRKNHELQRHLEKACRQLQTTVREHKTAMKKLKEEHESTLQKVKEEHLQKLEEDKKNKELSGSADQQHFQQGLEEMKQQYQMTVTKIRGDMMQYLQESRERAAEMIRVEVQRERHNTARKMRHYYLTCLQELLEDGGKMTGRAEKKIMSAASKLAAMAKVLETPVKSKSGKNYSSSSGLTAGTSTSGPPRRNADLIKKSLPELLDVRPDEKVLGERSADSEQKPVTAVKTRALSHQDTSAPGKEDNPVFSKTPRQKAFPAQVTDVSVRSKSRDLFLQGHVSENSFEPKQQSKPFLQELPVREEKRSDWSLSSNDSDTGLHIPRLSYSGRKVEPVKPFSASAASNIDLGEFGGLTPDASDLTVYNEIVKKTPNTQTSDFHSATMSSHRQPPPGSEGGRQYDLCSKPLFSELRQRQQDSGFDSPFYKQK